MIDYTPQKQERLPGFETPFEQSLDPNNRWIKLGKVIPWDDLSDAYSRSMSHSHGRPAKSPRLVIGAMIIKHKQNWTDEETVLQIQENMYLQQFCGFSSFNTERPFVPSLFVEIRKRMGPEMFDQFDQAMREKLAEIRVDTEKRKGKEKQKHEHDGDQLHADNIAEKPASAEDEQSGSKEQRNSIVEGKIVGSDPIEKPKSVEIEKPEPVEHPSAVIETETARYSSTDEAKLAEINESEHVEQAPAAAEITGEQEEPRPQGKLIIDATVAEQAIRYPTDLNILNEAREISEQLIDRLYPISGLPKKPRTYRQKARQEYLNVAKRSKPKKKTIRKAIRQQLQYLRRNLEHIDNLLDLILCPYNATLGGQRPNFLEGRLDYLTHRQMRQLWVIRTVYDQQKQMYDERSNRHPNRIVSISQPHVRPIVRGKAGKSVEFGAKVSASLDSDGFAHVDALRWDAFNESTDLQDQVEAYKQRNGYYPEVVLADGIYGTRDNRRYCSDRGIRFAGKPLGRPKKVTDANREEIHQEKKQRRQDALDRIPIEGKFGQGKNGYGLGRIRAKLADTSGAWIRGIFLVMNLIVLIRFFFASKISGLMHVVVVLQAQIGVLMRWMGDPEKYSRLLNRPALAGVSTF